LALCIGTSAQVVSTSVVNILLGACGRDPPAVSARGSNSSRRHHCTSTVKGMISRGSILTMST
uniref:Uncharacterized protein n=1 Tax=Aegilops tauschii subsp. strangulata TaxID=200361 RepID=A0A453MTM4_AEGTS